jgi:hypothetical protein
MKITDLISILQTIFLKIDTEYFFQIEKTITYKKSIKFSRFFVLYSSKVSPINLEADIRSSQIKAMNYITEYTLIEK